MHFKQAFHQTFMSIAERFSCSKSRERNC